MKFKKLISLVLVLVMTCVLFTGCSTWGELRETLGLTANETPVDFSEMLDTNSYKEQRENLYNGFIEEYSGNDLEGYSYEEATNAFFATAMGEENLLDDDKINKTITAEEAAEFDEVFKNDFFSVLRDDYSFFGKTVEDTYCGQALLSLEREYNEMNLEKITYGEITEFSEEAMFWVALFMTELLGPEFIAVAQNGF